MTRLKGLVEKGWGSEFIWATSDLYCGKILNFHKDARFSMHFHLQKDETWYVLSGHFLVHWIETTTATQHQGTLGPGSVWHNPPGRPHQLVCLEAGSIIEVSTPDSAEDNYRIAKGDSQK